MIIMFRRLVKVKQATDQFNTCNWRLLDGRSHKFFFCFGRPLSRLSSDWPLSYGMQRGTEIILYFLSFRLISISSSVCRLKRHLNYTNGWLIFPFLFYVILWCEALDHLPCHPHIMHRERGPHDNIPASSFFFIINRIY